MATKSKPKLTPAQRRALLDELTSEMQAQQEHPAPPDLSGPPPDPPAEPSKEAQCLAEITAVLDRYGCTFSVDVTQCAIGVKVRK